MDQLRRHQRITTPLEVSFDDYTPDIDENRLLVAATDRLLKLQGLGDSTRHCLHRLQRRLADVAHSLTHSLTHSRTQSLFHSLTRSFTQVT